MKYLPTWCFVRHYSRCEVTAYKGIQAQHHIRQASADYLQWCQCFVG